MGGGTKELDMPLIRVFDYSLHLHVIGIQLSQCIPMAGTISLIWLLIRQLWPHQEAAGSHGNMNGTLTACTAPAFSIIIYPPQS